MADSDSDTPLTSAGSVSGWLDRLQGGDHDAARRLWERYFPKLVRLAQAKLRGARPSADAEDVALSAFDTFCRNAEGGRFPDLLDRDGLWALLVVVTSRKAAHRLRDDQRLKRGGAVARAELAPEELLSEEPDPAFAAEVAEECRRLLGLLDDPLLETVALRKMEGCSTDEIAAQLGYAPRSIKRKVQMIRNRWEKELPT